MQEANHSITRQSTPSWRQVGPTAQCFRGPTCLQEAAEQRVTSKTIKQYVIGFEHLILFNNGKYLQRNTCQSY